MYTLSPYIVSKIEENPSVRLDLAKVLSLSESQISRLIRTNKPNGSLTKIAVIKALEAEFKIKECRIISLEKPKKPKKNRQNPKKSLEKI